ncbi:MAG: hypothetical protein KatS3mg039_0378 [Candidatus Kapaibacterium sp.]|nr:MAG: hypothetical protein KatS3mg039_0378 [Candidatus Kapabacteria bacterium]
MRPVWLVVAALVLGLRSVAWSCPTTFTLSVLTPQPCQFEQIVLELSGNETNVTYTLLANGLPLSGVSQSVVNGRRRFTVTGGLQNGSYTFSVQATLDTCTIVMGNVTLTVYTPAVPILSLSSLNQILCYGDPGTIVVVNTDPQASYTVRDGNTVVAGPTQGNGGQIQFVLPASLFPQSGMKTFSVRATALGNSQCYAETANGPLDGATFIVYGLPPAPQISAPEPFACSPGGAARVLVQNAVAGYVYQVLDGNTAVFSVLAQSTGPLDITNIPVTPASPGLGFGTRSVTVVAINPNNNNCRIQSTSSVTITVVSRPATPQLATGTNTQVYCDAPGGVTGYAIVANGEAGVTYEVRRVGTNALVATAIGQAGVVTIPISGLTASGSPHQFRVYAISNQTGCVSDPSGTLTIVVNSTPTVTASVQAGGSSATLCMGYTSSVTLIGSSSGAVSFQWLLNGSPIAGATTTSYTVPTGLSVGTYMYQLRATNSLGCSSTSSVVTVSVVAAPAVAVSSSGSTNLCTGYSSGPTLTSSVSGCSSATYQWQLNGSPISGATSSSYTVPAGLSAGTYVYTVVVTCGSCSATSSSVTVTVSPAPAVTISTSGSTNLCTGYSSGPTLTSSVSGCSSATYQWQLNGSPISGATSSSYTVPAGLSAGTYVYTVVVTCGSCSATSNSVTVTVSPAPTVTISASGSTNLCTGYSSGPTLTSSVSGCSSATYQWQLNGSPISGATSSSYTVPAGLSAGTYVYTVVVTCGSCSATSSSVTVTVSPAPTVTISASGSTNLCTGYSSGPTLTSSVSGCSSATYQWQLNGSPISGATSSSYTVPAGLSAGTYVYTVVVTCGSCSATSNSVTVTVSPAPTVTISASGSTNLCTGYSSGPTLTSSVSGCSSATYQWQLNGSPISGATGSSYTVPAGLSAGTYVYTVVVTCGSCSAASNSVTVTVSPAPTVTISASGSTNLCTGYSSGPTLTSSVSSCSSATYQWQLNGSPISGATSSSYTVPAGLSAGTYVYTVVVTCGSCSATSNPISITVTTPPTVSVGVFGSTSLCVGYSTPPLLAVSVSGCSSSVSYQWRLNGFAIPGATTAMYTVQSGLPAGTYSITVEVSCNGCSVTSSGTTLSVVPPPNPTIALQSGQTTFCQGASTTATLAVSQTFAQYQWQRNGSDIPGATNQTYVVPNSLPAGIHMFTVRVTDASGCSGTSTAAMAITVLQSPTPTISILAGAATWCVGSPISTVLTTQMGYSSYQWYLNGTPIPGATNFVYSVPTTLGVGVYAYTVVATNSLGCTGSSSPQLILVLQSPTVTATSSMNPATFCEGATTTPVLSATPGMMNYQWYMNGVAIPGANQATYTVPSSLTVGTYSFYVVGSSSNSCTGTSNTITVTVQQAPSITISCINNAATTLCSGYSTAPVLSASVGNCNGTISYQWLLNGSPIVGATNATYPVPSGLSPGSYVYRLQAMCGVCSSLSNTITVTVLSAPQASISASGPTALCSGYTAAPQLTSAVSGCSGTTTYQWYHNGAPVVGATSANYQVPLGLNVGTHVYTLIATCGSCSGTSNSISITVGLSPTVTASVSGGGTSATVCTNASSFPVISAVVSNCTSTPAYQWQLNGSPITGATDPSYTVPPTLGVGTWNFTAVVTCGGCSTTSNTVVLTVAQSPTVQINTTGSTSLCTGYTQGPLLTASASNCSGTPTYQWYRDGQLLTGATNASLPVPTGLASGTYSYAVAVTCGGCTATASVTVTVNPSATVSISTYQPTQLCTGYSAGPVLQSTVMCLGSPSYQWLLNGNPISGATGLTYSVPTGLAVGSYTYALQITCGSCTTLSNAIVVTVAQSPTVMILSSGSTMLCTGYASAPTLTASVTNCSGTPQYQWYLNNSPITGATTATYTIPLGLSPGSYSYAVVVTCGSCSTSSTPTTVVVSQAPSVSISAVGPTTLCSGYTSVPVLVASVSSCTSTPQYQWYLGSSPINGATASNFTLPTGLSTGTYNYSVAVTCGSCTTTSGALAVTVTQSPSVTIAASGTTQLCTGYSSGPILSSSVSNCSGAATYQWYLNNAAIVGATNSSYAVPTGLSAGLYTYTLMVTCASGCSGYSNMVHVLIQKTPTATATVSGASLLCTGYTTSPMLTVSVGHCTTTPQYQWYIDGSPITGATTSTYTLPTGLSAGTYTYTVSVTCGICTGTSNPVAVTVAQSPSVSIATSDATSLCTGYSSGPTLTSSVSNCSGTAQYQWYQNSVAIVGATSSSYTVPAGLSAGTYVYTLVVTCGSCSATSNSVTVTVSQTPAVTISTSGSTNLCTGYSSGPTLTSSVSNCSGTAQYQWYQNSVAIVGATSSGYTVPAGLSAGTYVYTVVVTCGGCSATSNSVTVTVSPSPSVTINANGSTSLCVGYSSGPTLTSSVSNCSGTAQYQWYQNSVAIVGATGSSYTVPAGLSAGTYTYTLVVTCGSCSATSSSVTVTVSQTPTVTISASGSTNLCTGYSSGPTLTSSVSNCSGMAQYQWYQNSVAIVGATSSSYTVPAGLSAGTYVYTLVVTCGSCSATSNSVTVTVSQTPTVTISASGSTNLCTGYSSGPTLTSSVSNCSGTAQYQWYQNSVAIVGATGSSYTVPAGLSAGTYTYTLVVTCGSCSATSNSVTVTVSPSPTVTISASGSTNLCTGYSSGPTLTSSVSNCSGTAQYQWYQNSVAIVGATGSSYTVPAGLSAGTYTYTLVVTCGSCSATSNSVTVTVSPSPTVTDQRERLDELVHRVFERTDADLLGEQLQRDGAVPVVPEQRCNRWRDEFELHGAGRLECGDVHVHAGCHVWQLQCDVEQRDGDGQPIAERDDQRQWFDEPVRWVFEWSDADLERGGMHEHGDVSVARQREPDQWCDWSDVRCAGRLECGDVHVHAGCHVRQLQCDVQQRDGDRQPIAERDDQRQWFDEPVRWVFERSDADLTR